MIVIAAFVAIAIVVWTDEAAPAAWLMFAACVIEGCTR